MDTGRGNLTQKLEEKQGGQKYDEVELLRVPNQGCSRVQLLMRSKKPLSSGVWLKSSYDQSNTEGRVNRLFFLTSSAVVPRNVWGYLPNRRD